MGKRLHRDITIRGKTYGTVAMAAQALGVQQQTVLKAIRAGHLDGVALGESHPKALPVRVRGLVYPTAAMAARDLGLSRSAIWNAIAQGRENHVGLKRTCLVKGKPVQVGPHRFTSMAEAGRKLGFSAQFVSYALRRSETGRQRLLAAAMALDVCQPMRVAA